MYIVEGYHSEWSGCVVRVPGQRKRLFSFSAFPSERECRDAARQYRDKLLAKSRDRGTNGRDYIKRAPQKNNVTGALGVSLHTHAAGYLYFKAELKHRDGTRRRKVFFIGRRTYEDALALAIRARRRFEKEKLR